MTGESQAQGTEHPVAMRLREAGITKALVIDDAYDLPTRDAHGPAILDFWARINSEPDLLAELHSLELTISEESDIDDNVLRQLWEKQEVLPRLGPILKRELFGLRVGELATLNHLTEHLSRLGVEAICVGSQQDLPAESVKLVFIDYYLGPGTGSSPVEAATAKAREIYDKAVADAEKPFIVLMSSKPDAEAAKDTFREASRLLGGLFGFVPKEQLAWISTEKN